MPTGGPAPAQTEPGDHVNLVYEDRAELYAFVLPFLKNGLERGERCVYIAAESRPDDITAALSAGGIPVEREARRGALKIVTPREYYRLPLFDPARAMEHLNALLADARLGGFAGLRVAGEMSWAGKTGVAGESLGDYEALLEKALGPRGPTVACIYRKDCFDLDALQRYVRTHGKVVAKDYIFLSLSELFRDLAQSDLQHLAESALEKTVAKGDVFFRQGDEASDVYLLTAGLAKLVRAEAMEDSRALVWDRATVVRVVLSHPTVSLSALRLLEDRVEQERLRLEDLASPDVRRRLGRLLLRLGDHVGQKTRRGIVVKMPLSRRDLAEMVGTSPYTASRILAEWRRQDILDAQRTRIVIRDRSRLAAMAGARAGGTAPKSAAAKKA